MNRQGAYIELTEAVITIPLADEEIKTNAKPLAGALKEAKHYNCRELANNPNFDYVMLQVEDLDNARIFELVSYPREFNRADVKHVITEYDY